MAGLIDITYTRRIPYPLDVAYAWLTDYQDDDPARAGAVIEERTVASREPGRVVLNACLNLLGTKGRGKAEVLLHPPDHWEARILEGSGRGSHYRYRLDPLPEGGCRLTVVYGVAARRPISRLKVRLLSPLVRRELGRMWDGFAASMERELGPPVVARAR
ncbi:MAG TPA: SRPBCC family protein [Candidatus Thermoplasmatota archaeon]|nr:SRPBCC family protein [Candidatus Thermoplasmatota archaeon]